MLANINFPFPTIEWYKHIEYLLGNNLVKDNIYQYFWYEVYQWTLYLFDIGSADGDRGSEAI